MKNKHQGFTLFEVLISMFIAGVAVLGLVALELNILRSSQSSFNYTLATIEANSLIEKTWLSLCFIENNSSTQATKNLKFYGTVLRPWIDGLRQRTVNSSSFTGNTGLFINNAPPVFSLNDSIIVSWSDDKSANSINVTSLSEALTTNNAVVLNVSYPNLLGGCK